MTTFHPFSKTGARGNWNKEVGGHFQASSSTRAWGSVWPAAQMESEQTQRAVLRAASWLAAWTAPHQRAQAGEDGGAVRGRAVGASEDGDRGSCSYRSLLNSGWWWKELWCVNWFNGQQEEEAEENCCNLKDLRDGLVGKMLVRKSGRVQLILGQVTLDVSLGTTCSFLQVWYIYVVLHVFVLDFEKTWLSVSHIFNSPFPVFYQELVSVSTEGRAGYLSVLGNVKHKIVCSPDFEALLERSAWFLVEG